MVMVDVDDGLYKKIKPIVVKNKLEYPTLQNFVNKAVAGLIKKESE